MNIGSVFYKNYMFVVWILKPCCWWYCKHFMNLWKWKCDIYVHIKMAQLAPKVPKKKKKVHAIIALTSKRFSFSVSIFISIVLYYNWGYSYFPTLTGHWLFHHDYCLKVTCIRFSFLYWSWITLMFMLPSRIYSFRERPIGLNFCEF